MSKARIGTKGRITIPRAIRDRLALRPGDRIRFVQDDEGVRIVASNRRVGELAGILPKPAAPVSLAEIDGRDGA